MRDCPKVIKNVSAKRVLLLPVIFLFFILCFAKNSFIFAAENYSTQIETLINGERQKAGLPSLFVAAELEQATKKHNDLMDTCTNLYDLDSCFVHTINLLGEPDLMTRIKQVNYNPSYVAENIAWGYTTPASVVSGWMNSNGHRANILSSSAKDLGCHSLDALKGNYQGMYWTCDFGKSSTSPNTTPTNTPSPTMTPSPTPSPRPTSTPRVSPTPRPSATPRPTRTPTPTRTVSRTTPKAPKCTIVSHKIVCL